MNVCAPYLALILTLSDYSERKEMCEFLAQAAEEMGANPAEIVAVGWVETGFRWVDRGNGTGPLQVLRRYWPGHPVYAGIGAWLYYKDRCCRQWGHGCSLADVRCAYNLGWLGYLTTQRRGCAYAERFERLK